MGQDFSQNDGGTTFGGSINEPSNQNVQKVFDIVKKDEKNKNNPALNLLLDHENAIILIKEEANRKISELQKTAHDESKELQKQVEDFENKLTFYKEDLAKVNNWMVGVVVGVSIAFVLAMFAAYWGVITDKGIYLKYADIYENYSDKNNALKDIISEQKLEINNLKNGLDILKAKNPSLK
jgi:hypothetical protein